MNDVERFAALIAGLEHHGLSRAEIARQTNLSNVTVWRYATGNVRDPKHQTVVRVEQLAKKYAVISPMK